MSLQKFGAGVLIGVTKTDASGVALAVPQPFRLAILQDISTEFSFEAKPLYGAYALPVDQGRGKAKLAFSAKLANIDGAGLASLHFGVTPSAGYKAAAIDVAGTVPGTTPFNVTPSVPNGGTWLSDLGVSDTSGNRYKRVASAPNAGEYSVSAGVYTFASGDANKAVLITFEYSVSASGQTMSLTNNLMGYSPSFQAMLYNDTKGSKLALKLTNCQSDKLALPFKNDDFAIADFGFVALDDGTGTAGYWSQA